MQAYNPYGHICGGVLHLFFRKKKNLGTFPNSEKKFGNFPTHFFFTSETNSAKFRTIDVMFGIRNGFHSRNVRFNHSFQKENTPNQFMNKQTNVF